MAEDLETLEAQERQFLLKKEALMRGSLINRGAAEGFQMQSKALKPRISFTDTQGPKDELAKPRRRAATRGAMPYTEFLRATGGPVATLPTMVIPVPTSAPTPSMAPVPCPPGASVEDQRPHTPISCNLSSPTGPQAASIAEEVALPCTVEPQSPALAEALRTIAELQAQLRLHAAPTPAAPVAPKPAEEETYGGKDYPAWLVENSCEEAAFEDSEEEEEGGAEAYVVVVCPRGECCAVAPAAGGGDRCPSCRTPFSPFKLSGPQAPHPCVLCGEAFCSFCSSYWTLAPQLGYSGPQRACKECHMEATGNLSPHPHLLDSRTCPGPRPPLPWRRLLTARPSTPLPLLRGRSSERT